MSDVPGTTVLGVFAKHWTPGCVKTRLAVHIGAAAASELYRRFVHHTVTRLAGLADRCILAYWPPEARAAFEPFTEQGWTLVEQAPGDLGQRMRQFFEEASSTGAERVVLVGSDSPTLPTEWVRDAFLRLKEYPVALGPSQDGGYYLIGVAHRIPALFDNIAWSTPEVWRQTVERLEYFQTPFAVLPEWYDVDELNDLRSLERDVARLAEQDAAWRPLRDQLYHALRSLPN